MRWRVGYWPTGHLISLSIGFEFVCSALHVLVPASRSALISFWIIAFSRLHLVWSYLDIMIIMADTSLPTLCWTALFNNSLVLIGVFEWVASMAGPKAFWGVSRTLRMAWASHQGNLVGWSSGWSPAHHGGQRPPRCYGCQARPLELWSRPNDKAREPGTARARRKGP